MRPIVRPDGGVAPEYAYSGATARRNYSRFEPDMPDPAGSVGRSGRRIRRASTSCATPWGRAAGHGGSGWCGPDRTTPPVRPRPARRPPGPPRVLVRPPVRLPTPLGWDCPGRFGSWKQPFLNLERDVAVLLRGQLLALVPQGAQPPNDVAAGLGRHDDRVD